VSSLNGPYGIAASGTNLFVCNYGQNTAGNTVGEYTTLGATVNSALMTLPNEPFAIAASGSDLYVASLVDELGDAVIGEYTTSGATVKANLITGLTYPIKMAVSGQNLFVANQYTGTLGPGSITEYDATTGAVVNSSLITGLNEPNDIEVDGSDLYVLSGGDYDASDGFIGEYTLGATRGTIQSSTKTLISGIDNGISMALEGSDLFVVNDEQNYVSEYSTSGSTINSRLISGLTYPLEIVSAPVAVPEPTTGGAIALVAAVTLWVFGSRSWRSRPDYSRYV
jgi:hypothetical protein